MKSLRNSYLNTKGSRQKKSFFYGQADRKGGEGGSAPSSLSISKFENKPILKIDYVYFFFAFLVFFHIDTKYIKLDWNSENFLIFWGTLMIKGLQMLQQSSIIKISSMQLTKFTQLNNKYTSTQCSYCEA